ncbi:hypothetical protein FGA82_27915 [Pseudomonas fluorescens]|nr:hypothetical protein FGA82_27915 [Pseudomonas fluorescens]
MGASLLAKASCQPTSMLNDRPLSRASSLPQYFVFTGKISFSIPGRGHARLQVAARILLEPFRFGG